MINAILNELDAIYGGRLETIQRIKAYREQHRCTIAKAVEALEQVQTVINQILNAIASEVNRAEKIHAPLNSAHEAYAVILEELDEFKAEVWKKSEDRDHEAMQVELIQCAAMCVRTLINLGLCEEQTDAIDLAAYGPIEDEPPVTPSV